MRVERVDPNQVALISKNGEALTIPNSEFLEMMYAVEGGHWEPARRDTANRVQHANGGSAARIRT